MPATHVLTLAVILHALSPSAGAALAVPADCDYLVVTDSLLLPEARRLADHRAANANDLVRKPHVATVGEIYEAHPTEGPKFKSLLAFLKDVHAKNGRLPDHLLLFGDASFDESSPDNRVPTYAHVHRSPSSGDWNNPTYDTASVDDVLADLVDTLPADSLRPKTALGRIPAASLEQARAYVDKAIAYETAFAYGPMAFTFGYANDDDRQLEWWEPITNMVHYHEELWRALRVKPFVRRMLSIEIPYAPDSTKRAARDSLLALINAGPARLYLIGRSSYSQFTDEKTLQIPRDLPALQPKALSPIVAWLGSKSGAFAHPSARTIGEEILFHAHGAVAFLGPVRETYPMPNQFLFQKWDDTASRGGTLGRSFAHAKAMGGADVMNNMSFVLLGDPGLTLRNPATNLAPASGSGTSRLVLSDAGVAGDSVYFQVVQTDTGRYADLTANPYLQEDVFIRERVVGDGYGILDAKGAASFDLPWAPNPRSASVKAMTWNRRGMRYGHFPIADLGPIAVRRAPGKASARLPVRVELRGTGVRVIRGARSFDLNGVIR